MHTWAGSMHIDLSVFCTHMFYIVLWIFVSPPDVNDSKILKEEYFLVLNCGCGYAAKFDIAAKYSTNAATVAVTMLLQKPLKPLYHGRTCSLEPQFRNIV